MECCESGVEGICERGRNVSTEAQLVEQRAVLITQREELTKAISERAYLEEKLRIVNWDIDAINALLRIKGRDA